MRFKEATPETSGCNSRGKVYYKRTSMIHVREGCANGKLRCCSFCDTSCEGRCELSETIEHQSEGFKNRFDCENLRPSLEMAWKWLGSE